jgi:hypothetical protein
MIVLLFSFILLVGRTYCCDFSRDVKSFYSFSGPVSLLLKDINLLGKEKLKGLSVFHPIEKVTFRGDFFPGGIFLAHETLRKLEGSTVFYDESRELTKIFSQYQKIKAIEIKTRGLGPREVLNTVYRELSPFLVQCSSASATLNLDFKLAKLSRLMSKHRSKMFLFFLGNIYRERLPEMLMVQDGIVKWLIEKEKLQTYPSPLAYVNWSSKIMNQMPSETLKIGLKDSGNRMDKRIQRSGNVINLTYPGLLIPGAGQVDGMIYLLENL